MKEKCKDCGREFPSIVELNLIIEIKNGYLLKRDIEIIKAKEKACFSAGFDYLLINNKDYTEFKQIYLQ